MEEIVDRSTTSAALTEEQLVRGSPENLEALEEVCTRLLTLLGEDPTREGLVKTPHRMAKAMLAYTTGYVEDPLAVLQSAVSGQAGS